MLGASVPTCIGAVRAPVDLEIEDPMRRFLLISLATVLLLGLGSLAVLARPAAPNAGTTMNNWIALPLSNPSLATASNLKAHIEANSGGSVTVVTVQQWNSLAQNYQTYTTVPIPNGDFALAVGGVYRVSVTGNGGAQTTWSMVGGVPDPSQFSYVLRETAGSDYNWIMLPLQKGAVTLASQLKTDIEANSHPAVSVITVQQWNSLAQNWQTFTTVPIPNGDFAVRIGYPYRVTIAAANPGTWP